MPFRTHNEEHAIVEAVFSLHVSAPFNPSDFDEVHKRSPKIKDFAPKVTRPTTGFDVRIENGVPKEFRDAPVRMIVFESFKSNGDLKRRVLIDDRRIVINRLDYEGWETTWLNGKESTRRVFENVLNALPDAARDDKTVSMISLEYIDGFVWEGDPDDFDVRHLLREECEELPKAIRKYGPSWHIHQGHFLGETDSEADVSDEVSRLKKEGTILNRTNLTSALQDEGLAVRMHNVLQLRLNEERRIPLADALSSLDTGLIYEAMEGLHQYNKTVMRRYFVDAILEDIGLA